MMSILSTIKSWFRGGLAYGPVTPILHVHSYKEVGKGSDTDDMGIVCTVTFYECSCGGIYLYAEYRDKDGRLISPDAYTAELKGIDIAFKLKSPDQPSPPEGSN